MWILLSCFPYIWLVRSQGATAIYLVELGQLKMLHFPIFILGYLDENDEWMMLVYRSSTFLGTALILISIDN